TARPRVVLRRGRPRLRGIAARASANSFATRRSHSLRRRSARGDPASPSTTQKTAVFSGVSGGAAAYSSLRDCRAQAAIRSRRIAALPPSLGVGTRATEPTGKYLRRSRNELYAAAPLAVPGGSRLCASVQPAVRNRADRRESSPRERRG